MNKEESNIIRKIAFSLIEESFILSPVLAEKDVSLYLTLVLAETDAALYLTLQDLLELAERNKVCSKYMQFDLEATRRERDSLAIKLNNLRGMNE